MLVILNGREVPVVQRARPRGEEVGGGAAGDGGGGSKGGLGGGEEGGGEGGGGGGDVESEHGRGAEEEGRGGSATDVRVHGTLHYRLRREGGGGEGRERRRVNVL